MTAVPDPAAPVQGGMTLAGVLAAHRLAGLGGYCRCGWASVPVGDRMGQHDAHVAAAVEAWLLSDDGPLAPIRVLADEIEDPRTQRPGMQRRRIWAGRARAALAAVGGVGRAE